MRPTSVSVPSALRSAYARSSRGLPSCRWSTAGISLEGRPAGERWALPLGRTCGTGSLGLSQQWSW